MRNDIASRLREDLIGPRSVDETLESLPSDTYLSGILWPPESTAGIEEDEDDENAAADENSVPDGGASILGQSKPSSMGLSFALAGGGKSSLRATFRFGFYTPAAEAEGKAAKRTTWQRSQEELEVDLVFGESILRKTVQAKNGNHSIQFVARSKPGPENSLLCTLSVSNTSIPKEKKRHALEEASLFQASLTIKAHDGVKFVPRPAPVGLSDAEKNSLLLLYRNSLEYATGHQVSPEVGWTKGDVESLGTNWIPSQLVPAFSDIGDPKYFGELVTSGKLSAKWLCSTTPDAVLGALDDLCSAYESWIDDRRLLLQELSPELCKTGVENLDVCSKASSRMRSGLALLGGDSDALQAFQLSNAAIQRQFDWKNQGSALELNWRPFQMAFILLTLESVLNPDSDDRSVFDLLWFPTGGGKTEAYLAIVGLAGWYRRLRDPQAPSTNLALMRYTLRLLTAQQFSRAAALILACEELRLSDRFTQESRPIAPFSIGLWVGKDASPNSFKEAKVALSDTFKPSPAQIEKCFSCDRRLDWVAVDGLQAVRSRCSNADCSLGPEFGLWPVMTVDDDIYRTRPTLLIGTVDKFAQVPLNAETKQLFGFGESERTRLIIQDELHLISGPLGTMVGLYETAFDYLLSSDGKPPKIIGSTATIRRAEEQIRAVFNRTSFQFPPPGLEATNSGFAVVDESKPGRLYLAVSSAGRSPKFAIQAVAGSIMQSASGGNGASDLDRDGYATLLMYYQSLRELGGALVQVLDDVPDSIGIYARARGEAARAISEPQELTSRVTQKEIVSMLKTLELPCSNPETIDAVLATNMVSVGLDISRLGVMILQGQPKTRSEYIQATSRVGRSGYPGIVVTVLNAAKTRDQSAYESFETWHSAIYRDVEPASATPFAPRAQERAVHIALVTMLRHSVASMLSAPNLNSADLNEIEKMRAAILDRCEAITGGDSIETAQAEELLAEFLHYWDDKQPTEYKNDKSEQSSLLQSAEELARKRAIGAYEGSVYAVPNSMRSVEPSSKMRITDRVSRFGRPQQVKGEGNNNG